MPPHISGQFVIYKGYRYRTLDGTYPGVTSAGYQSNYLPLPEGWMIADWHEDAHMVAESYPWGAHRIVHSETTNVHCSCTTLYVNCECSRGSGRVYVTRVVENVTEYKCYHNDRILIRQPVPVSTSTLTTTAGGVVLGDGVNVTTLLTLETDTTWNSGLYILSSTVTILPGVTLTIGNHSIPAAHALVKSCQITARPFRICS